MSLDDGDLVVRGHTIPGGELRWEFGPSGGPGGQHANRSSTRAELRFDLAASNAFPDEVKERMLSRLPAHLVQGGVVRVASDESRSQWRNRSIARRRLQEALEQAWRRPRPRRPTRPTLASRRRRREQKQRRSEVKRLRRDPEAP